MFNIHTDADRQTIKQAYRKLCKIYHPDLNPHKKEAEELFKQIQLAYEVLNIVVGMTVYKSMADYQNLVSDTDFAGIYPASGGRIHTVVK